MKTRGDPSLLVTILAVEKRNPWKKPCARGQNRPKNAYVLIPSCESWASNGSVTKNYDLARSAAQNEVQRAIVP
jgi:hypothetical protein